MPSSARAESSGGSPPTASYRAGKRLLDLVVAVPAAVLLSPVYAVIAVLVRRHDGGPVLYRAQRVGTGGADFTMYKFRTMVVDAESRGGSSTASTDPRITPVGSRLRAWKLDELPQLLNVVRGDMSLVGPRPQVRWDVERYTDDERRLLEVRPGITDWASLEYRDEGEVLHGHPDPDEAYDRLIRPGKIRLGLYYVDHLSLRQDLRILARTAKAVLGRHPGRPPVDVGRDG